MNHIEDLIAEHCTQAVGDKPLSEVGEIIRGTGLQKKTLFGGGTPAIHCGQFHIQYDLGGNDA